MSRRAQRKWPLRCIDMAAEVLKGRVQARGRLPEHPASQASVGSTCWEAEGREDKVLPDSSPCCPAGAEQASPPRCTFRPGGAPCLASQAEAPGAQGTSSGAVPNLQFPPCFLAPEYFFKFCSNFKTSLNRLCKRIKGSGWLQLHGKSEEKKVEKCYFHPSFIF